MNLQQTQLGSYQFFYRNQREYEDVVSEVFGRREYYFETAKTEPYILDCGSHIGLSVIYFKSLYPLAKIVAIEPDEGNCAVFERNILANNLSNVRLVHAAVSTQEGQGLLFGDFTEQEPRTCGNTMISSWANPGSESVPIRTVSLSTYIESEVDFLKLDIEGMETQVLKGIEDKLWLIHEIHFEFHVTKENPVEHLDSTLKMLHDHGFNTRRKQVLIEDAFPPVLIEWARESGFSLATIRARKKKIV
jgi:FkbM family methyltransferase